MKLALFGAAAAIGIYILWQRSAGAGQTVGFSGGPGQTYGRAPGAPNVGNSGLPPRGLGEAPTKTPAPAQRPSVGQTVGCAGGTIGGAGVAIKLGQPQFAPLAGSIGCTLGGKLGGYLESGGSALKSKVGSGVSTLLKKLF